jgi:hypothetical protein
MYSIIVLICSTALSHADCQAKTAVAIGALTDFPSQAATPASTAWRQTNLGKMARA